MKKGDRIIWDSGFGYDIAIFVSSGGIFKTSKVEFCSGIQCGKVGCIAKKELHLYSIELVAKLTDKYGYEKSFSETF